MISETEEREAKADVRKILSRIRQDKKQSNATYGLKQYRHRLMCLRWGIVSRLSQQGLTDHPSKSPLNHPDIPLETYRDLAGSVGDERARVDLERAIGALEVAMRGFARAFPGEALEATKEHNVGTEKRA